MLFRARLLLKSGEDSSPERRRRQRELAIAAAVFAVTLVLIFIQLQYTGSGSVVFFALFNLNALLLLGILFVVLRNAAKMLLERKQRIIGSRLQTRLTLAIVAMTMVPCLIMFLVTAQFVKLSVDFWFKSQIESSMDAATELAGGFISAAGKRLRGQGENILREIVAHGYIWGGPQMDAHLTGKSKEYNLALVGFLDSEKFERNWRPSPGIANSWPSVKEKINWKDLPTQGYAYYINETDHGDFMYGLLPISGGSGGYLALGEELGQDFQKKLDLISRGSNEYKQLNNLKSHLKAMLYLTLSILTALIMLSIIWFAFKAVKGITEPVAALVNATEKLASGEEDVRIEDNSSDEMGILVTAFNRMALEIIDKRRELTETNALLSQQNLVLDQQRQYVETVLDNLAAGVISFDAGWNITKANRAACQILGRLPEEILGRHIRDFMDENELRSVAAIASVLAGNPRTPLQRQVRYQSGGRELNLLVTVAGLASSPGNPSGAVAVFEDVTELEKMQRLAAWREVARRIAHEIKNPLTPIKLSAQRLEKRFAGTVRDPVLIQSTQLIVRQVEQLQDMVQEFSSFAKMPEIRLKRGRLEPILTDLFNMFQGSFPAIRWEIDLPVDLPDLSMDETALYRAFLNLFTNAAEALDKTEHPAVFVKARADKTLRLLRVEIGDNGPDLLTDEERARLFEPYFSRKKGGTGLGLTIVRSIITAHRGYARVSSLENGGTLFTVELPLE
jgi:two-component system nitrogen regulation sensor histidine kinase NtrY